MDACGTRRLVEVPGLRGGTPFVTVMEAAESGQGDDLGVTNGPGLPWAAGGCAFGEAEGGAGIMVIGDVVSQQAKQVAVVEDHDVVEELAAGAADPTFGDAVLPRAPWGGAGRLRTKGLHHRDDLRGERAVAVEDEVARGGVERERLAELLHDPRRVGLVGYVEVTDPSSAMFDHEPDIEEPER